MQVHCNLRDDNDIVTSLRSDGGLWYFCFLEYRLGAGQSTVSSCALASWGPPDAMAFSPDGHPWLLRCGTGTLSVEQMGFPCKWYFLLCMLILKMQVAVSAGGPRPITRQTFVLEMKYNPRQTRKKEFQNPHNSQGHHQGQTTNDSLNVIELRPPVRGLTAVLGEDSGASQTRLSVFLHARGGEKVLNKGGNQDFVFPFPRSRNHPTALVKQSECVLCDSTLAFTLLRVKYLNQLSVALNINISSNNTWYLCCECFEITNYHLPFTAELALHDEVARSE